MRSTIANDEEADYNSTMMTSESNSDSFGNETINDNTTDISMNFSSIDTTELFSIKSRASAKELNQTITSSKINKDDTNIVSIPEHRDYPKDEIVDEQTQRSSSRPDHDPESRSWFRWQL